MNKFLALLISASFSQLKGIDSPKQRKATLLVERCYKDKGLSPADELAIENLIITIESLSPLDQARVASLAHIELQKTRRILQKNRYGKVSATEKKRLEYELLLVSIQEKHLERFSALILQKDPTYKKGTPWGVTTFGPTKESYTKATQQLVAYTKLERQKLLHNSETAISFFHAQNNAALPKIMQFWWFKPEQNNIIAMARATAPCLTACAAELAKVGEQAAEETLDVVGDVGVEGVTGEQAIKNAQTINDLEATSAKLTDADQAQEEINQIANDALAEMTDAADPLTSTIASQNTELAGQPLQSLNNMLTVSKNATNDLAATAEKLTTQAEQRVNQQTTALSNLKGIYTKGLSGNVDSLMENSATRIQNGLEWLTKKYPNSTALKSLSEGFQSSREVYGGISALISKFGPLGIIKWLESTNTGKMIYGMLKLSIVMSGSSMFNAWINQQTFAAYTALSQFKLQLADAMQNNITRVQTAFAVKNAQLTTAFQTTFAQLNTAQASLQIESAKNITYLNSSLIESTMQQLYMSEPMYNDQLFLLSPMLTPTRPPTNTPLIITAPGAGSNWQTAATLTPQQQAQGSWAGPIVAEKKQTIAQATAINTNAQTPIPASVTISSVLNILPQQAPAYSPWYNIFRRGNWEFEVTETNGVYTGSFVQQTVVPLIPADPADNSSTPIFLQALYNSIFTQYIPPALYYGLTETHIIQIACTLNKVSYPFFMGFDFNAGRWLSGVDQLRYQRRTVGVLGSAQGQSALWFGETFYMQPQQALQAQVNAVWPLWQFFDSATYAAAWSATNPNASIATKPLYTDPAPETKNPLIAPGTTIIFSIATQPTQVTLSAQIAGSEEPFINNLVIPNLNPKVFVYHNIGLIAAGCSASFTILHPQALRYSQASLQAFLQQVAS